jgi:hypothetical protein
VERYWQLEPPSAETVWEAFRSQAIIPLSHRSADIGAPGVNVIAAEDGTVFSYGTCMNTRDIGTGEHVGVGGWLGARGTGPGCCGMAGSSGMRRAHREESHEIGRYLFEELQSSDFDLGTTNCARREI